MTKYNDNLVEITCLVKKYEDGDLSFMKYMKELNELESDTIQCGKDNGKTPIQIYREITLARSNGRKSVMRKKSKGNIKSKRKICSYKRK